MASIPPGQYVFITSDYHKLAIVLPAGSDQAQQGKRRVVWVPLHNEVEPHLSVSIFVDKESPAFIYQYKISNGKSAQDAIGYFSIVAPLMQTNPKMTQNEGNTGRGRWVGAPAFALVAPQAELPKQAKGRYLYWLAEGDQHGIAPNDSLEGFEIKSPYKPGFTTAYLSSRDLPSVPQDWPSGVYGQLDILNDPKWVKQSVLTLGPMFPPNLNRPEQIKTNFTEGIRRLIVSGEIDESSPWTQELNKILQDYDRPDELKTGFSKLKQLASPGVQTEITDALKFSLGQSAAPSVAQ